MVLSSKGKAARAKIRFRQKSKARSKARKQQSKQRKTSTSKKRGFAGIPIGSVRVDPGIPTSPERAAKFRELERQSIKRKFSKARLRGDIIKKNGVLMATNTPGRKVLSQVISVDSRIQKEQVIKSVNRIQELKKLLKGAPLSAQGRINVKGEINRLTKEKFLGIGVVQTQKLLLTRGLTQANIRRTIEQKTGLVRDLIISNKPKTRKEVIILTFNKVNKRLNNLNVKISKKLGFIKVSKAVKNLKANTKFSGASFAKFQFEVLTDIITDILDKPVNNLFLVVAGSVIGVAIKVGSKIISVIAKSSPRIAKTLRLGGRLTGKTILAAYITGVTVQGVKEFKSKGTISSTTADLIRELSLLGIGSRIKVGKKITKDFKFLKDLKAVKKGKKPSKQFLNELESRGFKTESTGRKGRIKEFTRQVKLQSERAKAIKRKDALRLEAERRVLRKQQSLTRPGKTPKAIRVAPAIRNGKPVWPFEDFASGKIRFFKSRKLWLKAIKQQNKAIIKGQVKIPRRLKKVIEFFKRPTKKTKKVDKQKKVKKIEITFKKGNKKFKVVRRSDGSGEIFQVVDVPLKSGTQILLKQKLVKLKTIQKTKTKQITKVKTKQAQLQKQFQKVQSVSLLKQLTLSILASALLSKQTTALATKSKQAQKLRQKQIVKQKTKQISKQKLRLSTKLALAQKQGLTQAQRTRLQKQLKQVKKTKRIRIEKKKKQQLNKLINKAIVKQKFIFIPDLFSAVFDIKATKKEAKAFLRPGRIFTGTEIRKLIR